MTKAERQRNATEWEKKQNTGLYAQPTFEQGHADAAMAERIEVIKQEIREILKRNKFR